MSRFQPKSWNRLIHSRAEIVAELPGTEPNFRRWVGIYPFKIKSVDRTIPVYKYYVVDFELDATRMMEYEGDEDLIMQNKQQYYVADDADLISILETAGIDLSLFDVPWKYDYPL